MIRIISEGKVPKSNIVCSNCHSELEYGNADLYEDYDYKQDSLTALYNSKSYYFNCPVCGCKISAPWIRK